MTIQNPFHITKDSNLLARILHFGLWNTSKTQFELQTDNSKKHTADFERGERQRDSGQSLDDISSFFPLSVWIM